MQLPVTLIMIFIGLSAFYYFMQVSRIRRERRRERLEERRQEFLDSLSKKRPPTESEEAEH